MPLLLVTVTTMHNIHLYRRKRQLALFGLLCGRFLFADPLEYVPRSVFKIVIGFKTFATWLGKVPKVRMAPRGISSKKKEMCVFREIGNRKKGKTVASSLFRADGCCVKALPGKAFHRVAPGIVLT